MKDVRKCLVCLDIKPIIIVFMREIFDFETVEYLLVSVHTFVV